MAAGPQPPIAGASNAGPAPRAPGRTPALRMGLRAIVLLGVIAGAVVVALSWFDWNRARDWLGRRASEAIGRKVEIRGELTLSWVRAGVGETGIARFVPWPQLDAHDVVVANPDWVGTADMATARHLRLRLRALPLLGRKLSFATIAIDGLDAGLVIDAQQRNNWSFGPLRRDDGGAPWTVEIRRLLLRHARVRLTDVPDKLDLEVLATSLDEAPYGLGLALRGRYHGTQLSGGGRAGNLLDLAGDSAAFPFDLTFASDRIQLSATGTLTDPAPPAVFDTKLTLAMRSMADVYPLTGVALPDTPPFRTTGRLTGSRAKGIGSYTYAGFSGTVGGSDLSGTVSFAATAPRPKLTGTVHSNVLRLADLGPSVGIGSGGRRAASGAARVLPDETLRIERLDAMDAQVRFTARQLVAAAGTTAEALDTVIRLEGGVLSLEPLAFGLAGGTVSGSVSLDSREADLKALVRASLDRLEMRKLMPDVPELHNSLGVIDAQVNVKGTGNSVARLLGSADGDVRVLMNRGSFSKILLEEAGLNVGNVVLGKLFGDRQIRLNCLAADFRLENGIVDTRTFLLDTEEARVPMTGTIDLRRERLDLTLRPEQKGLRILSLRAPIYLTGTFAQPDVSVDKAVVAARAGGALVLGLLAPVTAILPLIVAPTGDEAVATCKQALSRASDAQRASAKRP